MKFKQFFSGGRAAAIRKSVENRQEKAQKLLKRLQFLYDTIIITPDQSDAIKLLHVQYTKKQRELMEEYTQGEIDILEDKDGKYRQGITSDTKLHCRGCGKELDMSNFYQDGSGGHWCGDCWFKGLKIKKNAK